MYSKPDRMQPYPGTYEYMRHHTKNAYWILETLGNEVLREFIYTSIPGQEFDTHEFCRCFVSAFVKQFDEMVNAERDHKDISDILSGIPALVGRYLSKNSTELRIRKAGRGKLTVNLNLSFSTSTLWRKTEFNFPAAVWHREIPIK